MPSFVVSFGAILKDYAQKTKLKIEPEYQFDKPEKGAKPRRWKFDWAIPSDLIAFEYEGHGKGHFGFKQYSDNCEKYNEAQRQGWKVYRFTGYHMDKKRINKTLRMLDEIFGVKKVRIEL